MRFWNEREQTGREQHLEGSIGELQRQVEDRDQTIKQLSRECSRLQGALDDALERLEYWSG